MARLIAGLETLIMANLALLENTNTLLLENTISVGNMRETVDLELIYKI